MDSVTQEEFEDARAMIAPQIRTFNRIATAFSHTQSTEITFGAAVYNDLITGLGLRVIDGVGLEQGRSDRRNLCFKVYVRKLPTIAEIPEEIGGVKVYVELVGAELVNEVRWRQRNSIPTSVSRGKYKKLWRKFPKE
jgi:hypothetical protein